MKFTLGWLLEHLETKLPLEKIIEALIFLGFEVENCHSIGGGFVVAEVKECNKHPQADRLTLCKVFDGIQEVQVVCGASNVRTALKVVLAQVGAIIPSTLMKMKKSKIRGCESMGMLCSASELCLSEGDDGGILELGEEYKVGDAFTIDPLIEIAVTPNRGDVLSVQGVARELAAGGYGALIRFGAAAAVQDAGEAGQFSAYVGANRAALTSKGKQASGNSYGALIQSAESELGDPERLAQTVGALEKITVQVDSADACSKFSGLLIKDVRNCSSPEWLKKRLERIGVKSISAVVDIANYVMFSYGSPMHVYDADKIAGKALHVSVLSEERSFTALDEKEYLVPAGSVIIEDQDLQLQAVAGIIGSKVSACTLATRNIFLEAAAFNPVKVALAKRSMKLNTESAHRFERGIDRDFTEVALQLVAQMIHDICGGKSGEIESFFGEKSQKIESLEAENSGKVESRSPKKKSINFPLSFFTELTGVAIDSVTAVQILEVLGFEVEKIGEKEVGVVFEGENLGKAEFEGKKGNISDKKIEFGFKNGDEKCRVHGEKEEFEPRQLNKNDCFSGDVSRYENESADLLSSGSRAKSENCGETLIITPPSWRNDISTQACIVEEILRVYGYSHLRSNLLPNKKPVILTPSAEDKLRQLLLCKGFSEVITWSFMSERKCPTVKDLLFIQNPLSIEYNVMRPSIIPNLVDVAQKNFNNGIQIIKIFEVGKIYSNSCEEKVIAGLLCGDSFPRNLHERAHKMDFFDAKALLEALFISLNLEGKYFFARGEISSLYHPGKSSIVSIDNKKIGFVGELHPKITSGKKIIAFELYLDKMYCRGQLKENTFGKFPIVERDFSFVFDLAQVPSWSDIERDLYSISRLIKGVTLFDRYEGDFKAVKKVSLAFLVSMEDLDKGVSQEDIDVLSGKIIHLVEKNFSGVLRLSCQ